MHAIESKYGFGVALQKQMYNVIGHQASRTQEAVPHSTHMCLGCDITSVVMVEGRPYRLILCQTG